ncbi:MAG TPA: methylenetetrahydrofolate--tRNA-(uracil(54)-C(5))-methyltransferase (FADH(2)-oxidizing) TrmFO, partial [Bacillota bacterium]|nr:methylenetetrahydrofolate--tRNA-(uracil(54)-C(5))-methyltransferase (FADH(2)-oxidizing) TrmFO [Bacillota bacterium]
TDNAAGLLKEEMRLLDSLILRVADVNQVPAGQALAVDRDAFAEAVTQALENHPNISIIREEVVTLPLVSEEPWIVASGPLTSEPLLQHLQSLFGEEQLYFYDAAAPVVTAESLDPDKVYRASRYDKGEADYFNCSFNEEEYTHFWHELCHAEQHPLHDFERGHFFDACIPVEELALRGKDTLAFGPLKPIGLRDPSKIEPPYAVVQLRQDNVAGDLYGLVGFQTNLRFGEQRRIFRLIPGLEHAEFVRYGVMHKNSFLNTPKVLTTALQAREHQHLFFAGQLTGVEGYIESAATGLLCGINAVRYLQQSRMIVPPQQTMLGALVYYVTHAAGKSFQPMNAVFGIMPPPDKRIKDKRLRNLFYSKRALEAMESWKAEINLN